MNMKKRVFSFLLAIVMAFMPMLFAGCESEESLGGGDFGGSAGGSGGSSTPGQSSFYKQFIDGFKVVYSKSQIGQSNDIEIIQNGFFLDILTNLDKYYGSGTGGNSATFFPDSIRQTIYQKANGDAALADGTIIKNDKWLWTLNPNEQTTLNDVLNSFEGNNYEEIKESFKGSTYPKLSNENYYSIPLQIVLYETLLGYSQNGTDNRTMFEVEFVEGYEQFVPEIDITLEDAKYYKFAIKVKSSKNPILVDKYIYYYETAKYISYKKEGKTIVVVNESAKTLSCDQAISDYLETLKNSYKSTATYSGLTKTDADSLITYILNNVIGADVVKNDYVQFGPDQTTFVKDGNYYNYRNYVGRVAAMVYDFVYDGSEEFVYTYNQNGINITYDFVASYTAENGHHPKEDVGKLDAEGKELGFQFRPKTASFLRDYDTDMFFSNSDAFDMFGDSNSEAHSFDNSPMSEYQSVVIMPTKEMTLSGIWMQIFSPNPDLAIKVYIRYYAYDPTTGTGKLFTWEQDEIDFYQSEPYDMAYANKDCKYHKYVEGKGYLYKTTEKDNNGNKIEGYYTDFEVGCSVEDVPEQFVELYDRNDPNALQLDAIKLDKFNNSSSDPKLKAEGSPVNGIVESQLNSAYAYKVIPSKNGFGGVTVLDERKVNFSFYEMVFDIEKDISFASQNYDYKLSVVTPV